MIKSISRWVRWKGCYYKSFECIFIDTARQYKGKKKKNE